LWLCVVALSKNLKLTTTLDRAITQNPCYVPFLFTNLIKMETYQNYNGYGITYSSMTGTTKVDKYGFTIQVFSRMGEQKGVELAKSYIDEISCGVVS
jgi:hypothetical protein